MADKNTELICINCPRGCLLQVEQQGEEITVTGNFCSKGIPYAKQEIMDPQRVLTILMRPEGADRPLSVKTEIPEVADAFWEFCCFETNVNCTEKGRDDRITETNRITG